MNTLGEKMTELLTSAQMRAVEAAAIASGAVTGLELMERAGAGVVEGVLAQWPQLRKPAAERRGADEAVEYLGQDETQGLRRAVVLCGPGNNGGDGFVVARLLAERGWAVKVFLYGDAARLPQDARRNYERWCAMGAVAAFPSAIDLDRMARPDLVVDAIFGTGLTRPMPDDLHVSLNAIAEFWSEGSVRRVSVDLVSGMCADSGRYLEKAVPGRVFPAGRPVAHADLVVTFHRMKRGHVLADGPEWSGKVVVCDIGLAADPVREALSVTAPIMSALAKGGDCGRQGHKYSYGHALILSGPAGRGGAARLAARGALRIGAGLVTVACPPDALGEHAARLDAVMLREVAGAGNLAAMLEDRRISTLCLGPGLGLGARQAGLIGAALGIVGARPSEPRPALVLDADALTLIARDAALLAGLHEGCVLTPHAGEFARLFPDIAARLAEPASTGPVYSKVDATREAARQAGCVVVFKGADTVIAAPDGRCAINAAVYDRAAPWLATAGSGDVLAGFIAGLLARGLAPFDAACTGAWLHVEAALSLGAGLIAEDLPEELPKVFRALGL